MSPIRSGVLLPGLYADATIELDHKASAVQVPVQAVDQLNGKTTVDIVDAAGRIETRPVVTWHSEPE